MTSDNFLKDKIKTIPQLPGIYKMLDSNRNIIYVGKSKCLRDRVRSYFTTNHKWEKVARMVSAIRDIEYVVTDTHLEARLLECRLIKEYQPRFNTQMKNDQGYIYIKVEPYNPHRSLSVVSTREEACYGPFRSKFAITQFLNMLKNIFPLTKAGDHYLIEYHIFPVAMDMEAFESNRLVLLELFDKPELISVLMEDLESELMEAAQSCRFEIAAYYRDLIRYFTMIKHGLEGYRNLATKDILLKIPVSEGYKLFYVSNGHITHAKKTFELSENLIQDFLIESRELPTVQACSPQDEKSSIDYRDILYSEISALPEDMVMILW